MKKLTAILLAIVMLMVMLPGCSSTGNTESTPSQNADVQQAEDDIKNQATTDLSGKEIAFINCGPDDYYARYGEVLAAVAELYGWTVTELNSDYSTETELANVQDMIAKGVDAIIIIAVNFEAAAEACIAANEADIPIFFFGTSGNFDPSTGAVATGAITFNSYSLGYQVGKYIGENYPDVKTCAYVEGIIGSGSNEDQIEGFVKALAEYGIEAFSAGTGNYAKADAIPVVEDLLTSGREFDAIYSINDEMGSAIVQVFEENGVSDKVIVSTNGKEMCWEWLENDIIQADSANPPTLAADLIIQTLVKYFQGEEYTEFVRVFCTDVLTKENVGSAIPWDYEDYMAARAAGEFEYSIDYYADLMVEMEALYPWMAS